ncbi:MAG: GNAT family N-acetyltransferase [Thermoplasmatota archaeon]
MVGALASDAGMLAERLERAYFDLARTSSRWFERRTAEATLGGFAGLDAASMNRAARLALPDSDDALTRLVVEANEFFGEREVAWCIQLTPFDTPAELRAALRARGHHLIAELTVMTRDVTPLGPSRSRGAFVVEREEPDDLGEFTRLTIDAFRMPERYLPGLVEVNAAWAANGAAFVARADGEGIGTALVAIIDGVAGIYNVSTKAEWRRRGVAHALMRATLDEAAARGADLVTLQVASGSVAEAIYARMGFGPAYTWELYAR